MDGGGGVVGIDWEHNVLSRLNPNYPGKGKGTASRLALPPGSLFMGLVWVGCVAVC